MDPYRFYPALRKNPSPWKALARLESNGHERFYEAGFFLTKDEATRAAQKKAKEIEDRIEPNYTLAQFGYRTCKIDYGTAFYPYVDEHGNPVKE